MTLLSSLLQSLLSACEEGMGRHSIVNMVFFISKWHIRLQQIGHMESQETVPIFMWKVSVYYPFNGKAAMKWGLPMLKCIWHEKYSLLIRKAFQNTEEWRFSFWNIFFRFRDIDVCLLCKLDRWWRHTVYKWKVAKLTNRFHVAVRLFSNRWQMTSKCGKNKQVAHEAMAECVADVLTTVWRLLWSITEQTLGNMESICFIS